MVNPNDANKSNEAVKEEHLQDVSSEQENIQIVSPASSATSAPTQRGREEDAPVANNQEEEDTTAAKQGNRPAAEGTSSNIATLQIKKSKKEKGHLTIQFHQEDASTADQGGGGNEKGKVWKRLAAEGTSSSNSSLLKKARKKGELHEVPSGSPKCYLCKKTFKSWKGVFGHMRKHKVGEARKLRGAFPPPDFTPPGGASPETGTNVEEELAPVLLNLAQQVLSQSTRPDGLIIDLNQPGPSSHYQEEPTRPFDLNEPPPKDEEKDNDDEQNMDGGSDAAN
ncbi:hypothetical protein Ddye_009898 [Dipteronia dyeriana]|uniref:C2H2-type domain-containing protein n=1 Tax=Dipteronia dyeriana TaxID=168575 RepID=A0AAE0CMS3_9ROSI|nr:hypothetical protein Ddye_009898 [Dipteronia dyeriana]